VKGNKGSAGVDRMTVDQLGDYLKQQLAGHSGAIVERDLRTETGETGGIPSRMEEGCESLAFPTVLDRFVQQAVMQVLQRQWNPTFSQYSYGFRHRRSARHAVAQAQAIYRCRLQLGD